MSKDERQSAIQQYLTGRVRRLAGQPGSSLARETTARLQKAFALLPSDTQDLLLSGTIDLAVIVAPNPGLPMGMQTTREEVIDHQRCTIITYEEHQEWSEEVFIGAFLRQLAHVVAGHPSEEEWPASRAERARFKELLEHQADALLWRWGLKDYSMCYIQASYAPHRVPLIMSEIERLLEEGPSGEIPH